MKSQNDKFCDYCDKCLNNNCPWSSHLENAIDDGGVNGDNREDVYVSCEYYEECMNNYDAICENGEKTNDDGNPIDYLEYLKCQNLNKTNKK